MLIRIAGIALTALAPVLWGFARSRALRARETCIDGLILLVGELEQGITFLRAPISEIAARLKDNTAFAKYAIASEFLRRVAAGVPPARAWEECEKTACEANEQTVMDELFLSLGRTDAVGQAALCAAAIARLRAAKEESAGQAAEKGRLYRSLGMLAGAFFAIILL